MNRTTPQSQLKSNASTRDSHATPIIFQPNSNIVTALFSNNNNKRFVRKRDSSTQSLKRIQVGTPKSSNTSLHIKSSKQRQNEQHRQLNIQKIAQNTGYVKGLKSTSFMKLCESSRKSSNHNINDKSFIKSETQLKQSDQQTKINDNKEISILNTDKNYNNFRILSSSKNLNYHKKQYETLELQYDKMPIYTQRQNVLKTNRTDAICSQSQLKILQSEILILQDQNTRLKRQINKLITQKQIQRKKCVQLQKIIQKNNIIIQQKQQQNSQIMTKMRQQMQQICMKMHSEIFKIDPKIQKYVQPFSDKHTHKQNNTNINITKNELTQFWQQTWNPCYNYILQCIQNYYKFAENLTININKLQIKHNVMLRGQNQLIAVKNELKSAGNKLKLQKDRAQRYIQMIDKLKIQIKILREKQKNIKFSNQKLKSNSFNIPKNQMNKNINKEDITKQKNKQDNQDAMTLDLSEDDEQNSENYNNRSSCQKIINA